MARNMDRALIGCFAVAVLLIALYGSAFGGDPGRPRPWHPTRAARSLAEVANDVRVSAVVWSWVPAHVHHTMICVHSPGTLTRLWSWVTRPQQAVHRPSGHG